MRTIARALCRVGDAFEADFLTYAALAGKIEAELCTSLAWRVRRASESSRIKVVREWRPPDDGRKIDLAVSLDGKPCARIESKQWRSFNFASWGGGKGHRNPLRTTMDDIEKLLGLEAACDCFIPSFCVHCDPTPRSRYGQEIKYLPETIRAGPLEKHRILDGFERLRGLWGGLRVQACGEVRAGQAFGVRVAVHYWLLSVC